jgi:hypothetical protein
VHKRPAQFGFKYYSLDYKTGSGRSAFGSRLKMPMIWMSYTYHFTSF